MLQAQIAESLEGAFSDLGFAEPGVAQLKDACNVSLRTLYKHYPSKEAMIIGALEHRHQRYIGVLKDEIQDSSSGIDETIEHIFDRLQDWMQHRAPNGCMSNNALAAFPHNEQIHQVVKDQKAEVRQLLGQLLGLTDQHQALVTEFFLLHEGASIAWPLLGENAISAAKSAAHKLLQETSL